MIEVVLGLFVPFANFVNEKDPLTIGRETGIVGETTEGRPIAGGVKTSSAIIAAAYELGQLAAIGPHSVDNDRVMRGTPTGVKDDTGIVSGDLYLADILVEPGRRGRKD